VANARTRFDVIREYMVRQHEAKADFLYGRPCASANNRAFIVFIVDHMAFRLHGRALLQALTLKGAKAWDPLGRYPDRVEWAIVPPEHFLRWDRLAIEAYRVAKEGRTPADVAFSATTYGPPPAPVTAPPSIVARFTAFLKRKSVGAH
jgi:hypothetical protein